uniref:Uncharacterized protein n=1 Tax=Solanum tuberosum TaxID=4113 RepID=M1CW88_SOLTU
MERRRELIFLCSSPGNRCWNLILSEFSPNFYCSTNRHLVKLPSSIISRFAGPNGFSLLNSSIMDYLRSGQVIFSLRSLTCEHFSSISTICFSVILYAACPSWGLST